MFDLTHNPTTIRRIIEHLLYVENPIRVTEVMRQVNELLQWCQVLEDRIERQACLNTKYVEALEEISSIFVNDKHKAVMIVTAALELIYQIR